MQLSIKKNPPKDLSLVKIKENVRKETRTAALFIHVVAQQMNVQFTDIRCLDYLMTVQSATAGEIAKITELTTGAVTAMIDRLEKANFVQRKADESDRRKIIITLKKNNFQKSNIANIFFTHKVTKLLSKYTPTEQALISQWNINITELLQKEIKKLTNNQSI
jgi:DNA-binding MarR family transcriptional regulator